MTGTTIRIARGYGVGGALLVEAAIANSSWSITTDDHFIYLSFNGVISAGKTVALDVPLNLNAPGGASTENLLGMILDGTGGDTITTNNAVTRTVTITAP
ncbi:hypothetical protein [Leucobacter luti]|nr:hypothetical protein [Leucobacter luti]